MEFLSLTLIFMMLLGTVGSSDSKLLQDRNERVSELYQNSCTPSGWKNYTDQTVRSCSQKCSCQPDCHEVGTCCPDMPGIDDLKPKYECRDIADFYHNRVQSITVTGLRFRVVDDCPNAKMSKEYPRCVNATYLDDFIIVSDLLDERIYRNHHCARCHGISEYVSWRAEVYVCNEIMYERFSSFEERNQYILKNCVVKSVPPQGGIGEMSRCFSDYSSDRYCKRSTNSTVNIPSAIEALCNTSRPTASTMFFVERTIPFKRLYTYPNIFCYFCELGAVSVNVSCEMKTSSLISKTMTLRVTVSALLTGPEELTEKQADDKCAMTSIWDPYSEQCRTIFCQLGTIPVGKKCLPVLRDMHGVALSLFVIISVPPGYLSYTQNISPLVDNILQGFVSQHGAGCGLCDRWFLNINESRSEVFMEFPLFTTDKCSVNDILTNARNLMSKGTIGFQMRLNNDIFNIWLKLSTNHIGREFDYEKAGMIQGNECMSRRQLVDWMFLDCPHFRLRSESLETLGLGFDVQKNLLHKMVMTKIYNSSDIAICVNDYFSIRLSNSAKKNYIASGLFLLTFLLPYLS